MHAPQPPDPNLLLASASLPHRYPLLLLDRVLVAEPGRWLVGLKNVTLGEALIDADGRLPPVLLVEIMAQAAGLAVVPRAARAPLAVLGKIDRFRCRPPIVAGDQLLVIARVRRRFGPNAMVHAAVSVDGRRRAAAELMLHVREEA